MNEKRLLLVVAVQLPENQSAKTRASTQSYRDGWDAIFGQKQKEETVTYN